MASRPAPPKKGIPAKEAQNLGVPNQTLYCTNLPDRISKDDLRRALYMLFSTYGPVLDIVTLKGSKRRGQAHIVYRDIQTSTQAMRALQGFDFFGKDMKIVYAKGLSHIISKLRGTFEMPTAAPVATESTELQRSIFNAPPSSIPSKPAESNSPKPDETSTAKPPQGTKRLREEDDEDEEKSDEDDAPMEEDDESDAPMDASSDDDR